MGATTPFLSLYKPGGGSTGTNTPDEVADIDRLNLNFDAIDAFASSTDNRLDTIAGVTVVRNQRWPLPTTDPQRVSLANQKVVFYNTDLGWWESYYAVTGLPGLTAQGLVAGTASGWYPIATGPRVTIYTAVSGQAMTTNEEYSSWTAIGSGFGHRRGGSPFFTLTNSTRLIAVKAGRYRVTCSMFYQQGTGTAVGSLRISTPSYVVQKPVPLLASFGQQIDFLFSDVPIVAGASAFFRSDTGSLTVGANTISYLAMEYLGPYLASD